MGMGMMTRGKEWAAPGKQGRSSVLISSPWTEQNTALRMGLDKILWYLTLPWRDSYDLPLSLHAGQCPSAVFNVSRQSLKVRTGSAFDMLSALIAFPFSPLLILLAALYHVLNMFSIHQRANSYSEQFPGTGRPFFSNMYVQNKNKAQKRCQG